MDVVVRSRDEDRGKNRFALEVIRIVLLRSCRRENKYRATGGGDIAYPIGCVRPIRIVARSASIRRSVPNRSGNTAQCNVVSVTAHVTDPEELPYISNDRYKDATFSEPQKSTCYGIVRIVVDNDDNLIEANARSEGDH